MVLITVLVPCKNEEKYIENCINSVREFDLPDDVAIELLVIDGLSDDKTIDIVKNIAAKESRLRLLINPGEIQAHALNIGIDEARGEWILRLDAHASYGINYLKLCWETAQKTHADNVGGLFITKPGGDSYQAKLIQALTTHPFGVGNAGFRIGMSEGYADTVPYGFYRRSLFSKIGYLDQRLVRAQDYEFNRRLIKCGGKIWRNPKIHVNYFNQPTLRKFLVKQIKYEAPYNAYMWYLAPYTFAYRHAITAVFVIGILGGIPLSMRYSTFGNIFGGIMILYAFLAIFSAVQQAKRYKLARHYIALPISFFLYHFVHGLGVLKGLFLIFFGRAPIQKQSEPWEGYGRYRINVKELNL